ncbi:hypothetical protein TMatcc_008382 [Talaromyces marneffei ATCC 18224]
MLPLSLLNTRPVTTKQADGTYKEAYADGGRRAYDRTFPIMFLETNEFAWIPNTDLTPLDPEQCKDVSEKGKQKQLIAAYKVAAEGHDLEYFKNLLADHQRAIQQEAEEREAAAAEKAALKAQKEAAKEEKKKKRTSVAAETEDVEMADADEGDKKAKTKKRKKDAASDVEDEKPTKTPKTTTKLKLSTPKDPNAAQKPKSTKAKKAAEKPSEEVVVPPKEKTPQIDPQEAKANKQKRVLFLRHKLQKGFLQRDQAPKEEEMEQMTKHLSELEAFGEIEVSIIRETKINKVLRAIIKLPSIPKEEQYRFRARSIDILQGWKTLLDSDIPTPAAPADKEAKPESNGVKEEATAANEPKVDEPEPSEAGGEEAGDQTMADAAPEEPKKETATEEAAGDASKVAEETSA